MSKIYDYLVIGAGISACTFASFLNKRFSDASVLLVERGRRIGGRATTRKSRKNKILEFDHGLPSINFSPNISHEILTIISPLIESKKLVDISKNILFINESGVLNNVVTNHKNYRSVPCMANFCQEIINQSSNPKKINFLFKTIIDSINLNNKIWEVKVNNGNLISTRNLILSSSLLAHPRCLKIMRSESLPLRDAFKLGQDKVVDSLLRESCKLNYIKRRVYIFYVSNFALVQKFNHNYLQVIFSNGIKKRLNFERIIFQRQSDGSMIILLHCYYLNNLLDIDIDNTMTFLKSLFANHLIFIDLFLHAKLINTMDWRASQVLNQLIPKELQWSSTSKIGFCGDWFNMNSNGGVESAMNSSIRLVKILNEKQLL